MRGPRIVNAGRFSEAVKSRRDYAYKELYHCACINVARTTGRLLDDANATERREIPTNFPERYGQPSEPRGVGSSEEVRAIAK